MKTVSLLGVASYLPETIVTNDFFAKGAAAKKGMFTAPTTRRHVRPGESAADMIERAAERLIREQGLDPGKDIDVVFTNVAVPDQAFTVAAPKWPIGLAPARRGSWTFTTRAVSPSST
jgi:3-oxoacyl-[acyl-carrier-protein] synthase-3